MAKSKGHILKKSTHLLTRTEKNTVFLCLSIYEVCNLVARCYGNTHVIIKVCMFTKNEYDHTSHDDTRGAICILSLVLEVSSIVNYHFVGCYSHRSKMSAKTS